MFIDNIIKRATQLFNLNDPIDRLIAGDWVEQSDLDETITNLTAVAIRSSILVPEVLCMGYGTSIECSTGYGIGRGTGAGAEYGIGAEYGFGTGFGSGNGTGIGCGTGTVTGNGDGAGRGTGDGDSCGYGSGFGRGTGYGDGFWAGNVLRRINGNGLIR